MNEKRDEVMIKSVKRTRSTDADVIRRRVQGLCLRFGVREVFAELYREAVETDATLSRALYRVIKQLE